MEYGGYSGQSLTNSRLTDTRTATEAAPEPSPIRDGVTNSEQALSQLHEVISRLERRLETVLKPAPPQGQGNSPQPTGPPCSHVMGRLHMLNDGFNAAIARLQELTSRVEV
jgi:hypothetical protein